LLDRLSPHTNRVISKCERFTGGDPLPADDIVGVDDFAAIAESAFQPIYKAVDPDPFYLFMWNWIKKLAVATSRILQPLERHPS